MITSSRLPTLVLAAAVLYVNLVPDAAAQLPAELQLTDYPRAWLSAGVGVGSGVGDRYDLSAGATVNFALPGSEYLGQLAFNGNWPADLASDSRHLPYAAAAGVGIGRALATYDFALAGSVGPAVTWGRERATGAAYTTGGVLLGSQFFVTPARLWGLGIEAFALLHTRRSYFGVRMAVQIGSARSR